MFNTTQMPEQVKAYTRDLLAEADMARLANEVRQANERAGERAPVIQMVQALVARLVAPVPQGKAKAGITSGQA